MKDWLNKKLEMREEFMENSYRFFRNTACKYLPCHKTGNIEDFNCIFCFCPLYYFEDCGGNYTYFNGIKDCSSCLIPHKPKGYDYINEKIIAKNKKRRKGIENELGKCLT